MRSYALAHSFVVGVQSPVRNKAWPAWVWPCLGRVVHFILALSLCGRGYENRSLFIIRWMGRWGLNTYGSLTIDGSPTEHPCMTHEPNSPQPTALFFFFLFSFSHPLSPPTSLNARHVHHTTPTPPLSQPLARSGGTEALSAQSCPCRLLVRLWRWYVSYVDPLSNLRPTPALVSGSPQCHAHAHASDATC